MSTHLTTQELDGNRIECSHRSGVARAAEVFRKISQNFSPAGVRSPFVARAIPMDTNSVDDWALLRELLRGNGDVDRYISDLSRPDALTASLNWYRANLAPRMPGSLPTLPPVEAPTLGIWSTNDHYLDGERMKMSGRFLKGPWRYEQIDGASHWIPLDASDRLNQLLIEWLG
jgi:pimeloyl-ACP methyl ester carboxylesterase